MNSFDGRELYGGYVHHCDANCEPPYHAFAAYTDNDIQDADALMKHLRLQGLEPYRIEQRDDIEILDKCPKGYVHYEDGEQDDQEWNPTGVYLVWLDEKTIEEIY